MKEARGMGITSRGLACRTAVYEAQWVRMAVVGRAGYLAAFARLSSLKWAATPRLSIFPESVLGKL